MATAWHNRVSNYLPGFQTTEQLAVSIDRQTAMGVHRHLMEVFTGANRAAAEGDKFGRGFLDKLERVRSGKVRYVDHQRPSSPVRTAIIRSVVATNGHEAIATPYLEFTQSGYSKGLTEVRSSDLKGYSAPENVTDEGHVVVLLPDHLIVNGEMTALGKAHQEWSYHIGKDTHEFVPGYLKSIGVDANKFPEQYKQLEEFIIRRLDWYGQMDPDTHRVFHEAVRIIQDADREGLKKINAMNDEYNKRDGTRYAGIRYEPWRLDAEVSTKSDDVTRDALLGSYADNDRMMGKRYSTTPDNQIHKAENSGITSEDVIMSPEDISVNRFTRLANETFTRKARAGLANKAKLLENTGYNEQAVIVKNYILDTSIGIKERSWLSGINANMRAHDNSAMVGAGILLRNISNPFIGLASLQSTTFYQPLQQAVTQLTQNPSFHSVKGAAEVVGRSMWDAGFGLKWAAGVGKAIFSNTQKLNVETNGRSIKIQGIHAAVLEDIYEGVTKRTDPTTQIRLVETRRGGKPEMKAASRFSATAPLLPEAASTRMMFLIKEASENRGARALLPQIGGIWETALARFEKGGEAELHRYLGTYMEGSLANPALQMEVTHLVGQGKTEEALRVFGTYYVNMNIGTWNASNIPKNIRLLDHTVPGAATFYTAATLGTHRAAMAIMNMKDLSAAQKAASIMSVTSALAISTGIQAAKEDSGMDFLGKMSPMEWAGVLGNFSLRGQFDQNTVPNILKTLGTRMEVRSGQVQAVSLRQVQSLLSYISSLAIDPILDVKKGEAEKVQTKSLNRLVAALLDTTPYRPIVGGVTGMTPLESLETFDRFKEGLYSSTLDEEDMDILRATMGMEREKTIDMMRRVNTYAMQSGNDVYADPKESVKDHMMYDMASPLLNTAEGITMHAMYFLARASMAVQEEAWAEFGYADFRNPWDQHPDARIIARGAHSSDIFAKKYYELLKGAIERYEAKNKAAEQAITGESIPIPKR
jgi:hypothetical protein